MTLGSFFDQSPCLGQTETRQISPAAGDTGAGESGGGGVDPKPISPPEERHPVKERGNGARLTQREKALDRGQQSRLDRTGRRGTFRDGTAEKTSIPRHARC